MKIPKGFLIVFSLSACGLPVASGGLDPNGVPLAQQDITPRTKGSTLEITPRTKGGTLLNARVLWPADAPLAVVPTMNMYLHLDQQILSGQSDPQGRFWVNALPAGESIRMEAHLATQPQLRLKALMRTAEGDGLISKQMDLTLETTALVAILDWALVHHRSLSLEGEQLADPTVRDALERVEAVMRPYYLNLTAPLDRPVDQQEPVLQVLEQVVSDLEVFLASGR
ncbi:MAG: hypothetical protein ACO1RX_15355 [Candidatus Sericytochromatia bacterium]